MASSAVGTKDTDFLTSLAVSIPGLDSETRDEVTVTEVNLTESLLTPGLQTNIRIQNKINDKSAGGSVKNLDNYYGKDVEIIVERPILETLGHYKFRFTTKQKIYRLSKRERINYEIESFELDACDISLLRDAQNWVSKSWECETPSKVVEDVLRGCLGVFSMDIESSAPPRPYFAENVHPFQAITQQEEVALTTTSYDPSFVHFMTYQTSDGYDTPTHNFRSLTEMSKQNPVFEFIYGAKAAVDLNYAFPSDIMNYSFPCDFDLLSDILNNYDGEGNTKDSIIVQNPLIGAISQYGDPTSCGTTPFQSMTNLGTEKAQESCATNVEQFLRKRKARMALLEQDKIALRLTVPWNPMLNVGRVITANFGYIQDDGIQQKSYGSGDYLIVNMTHNIKLGGLGTTVMDCVSKSVGQGRV